MGPVVDVEFEQGKLPTILTALTTNPAINDEPDNLVVEVAQHLGDNVVRTIAMDVTDGLVRGMPVKDTGSTDSDAGGRSQPGPRAERCRAAGGRPWGRSARKK
jgi:F0F1-type ATP synthase beta subunit